MAGSNLSVAKRQVTITNRENEPCSPSGNNLRTSVERLTNYRLSFSPHLLFGEEIGYIGAVLVMLLTDHFFNRSRRVKFLLTNVFTTAVAAVAFVALCVCMSGSVSGQVATVEPDNKTDAKPAAESDQEQSASPPKWTADPEALKRVSRDIKYMASDELSGRKPGTPGIQMCEDFIVAEFKKAGVKPLDSGSYLQAVSVPGPRKMIKTDSTLELKGPDGKSIELQLGENFQQLRTVRNKTNVGGDLVFAGYGITAEEHLYDDFQNTDFEGKIVVLLRMEPQQQDVKSVFNGNKISTHSAFKRKAKLARDNGAVAVLIVNDRVTAPDEASDVLMATNQFKRTICPVAQVKRSVINEILKDQPLINPTGAKLDSLEKVEDLIDSNLEAISQPIRGWSAELNARFGRSSISTNNIIGVVEGEGPHANETVIIGGHYDHLGMGGFGAKNPNIKEIHNGADDNATGTAAVIELARRFAKSDKKPGRRLVFICFTAEEMGLIGARHYVKDPLFALNDTIAMVNFDMIGWLRKDELTLYNWNTSPEFSSLFDIANAGSDLSFIKPELSFGGSDHLPFNEMRIPNTFIHTGLNDVYHTPEDDFELINCEGALKVIDYSEKFVRELAAMDKRPTYGRPVPFRLGVRLVDNDGEVQVIGVIDDSLASNVGIKEGDVIVEFAGEKVTKRRQVSRSVRKLKGQDVKVKLMRKEKEINLDVKLVAPE